MNRDPKIILGMTLGVVIIFASALGAYLALRRLPELVASQYSAFGAGEQTMSDDPADVRAAAASIAAFDLPSGFKPQFMTDMYDMVIVAYQRGVDEVIMLMQTTDTSEGSVDELQQSMRDETGEDEMKVVEQRSIQIKGQPAALTVYESTAPGEVQRWLYTTFKNRSGVVLLSVYAPAHAWNQTEIDAFIASIH